MSDATSGLEAIKSRIRAIWSAGDFSRVAEVYEQDAADFVARLGIQPDAQVLDACCGSGNLAIPAARAGASVTGIDIVPALLQQARRRAETEHLTVRFEEGDIEQMSYADGAFDFTLSMFGVMFGPRPEVAAAELMRVTRPGGRLALANWKPGSFIAELFKTTAKFAPPAAGMPSPLSWGEEGYVFGLLKSGVEDFKFTTRRIRFRFPYPPEDVTGFWLAHYGPAERAYSSLARTPDKQHALGQAYLNLWRKYNRAADGTTEVESEYLELVAIRRPV